MSNRAEPPEWRVEALDGGADCRGIVALPPPPPPIEAQCPAEARQLHRDAKCGYVRVPRDRTKPDGKTIKVYFERYPRRHRELRKISTVVSIEGGPGYPVTPGRSTRVELWHPVSGKRDLVLIDLRGTGRSAPLGCEAFSRKSRGYVARAGRCAAQIGPERDLYSTSQAVQDMEAVLRSLHAGKIDLYGDSYGTYAVQAYALRFPERLRSLVLGAAYPLPGTDPAWADFAEAVRRGLELSCSRSVGCPTENPVKLVERFADRVRETPILGFAPDGDGARTKVRLNEDAFVQLVSSSYWYPGLWRDLPAAIRSANAGDQAPILRLAAETVIVEAGASNPRYWSEALYLAVICHDYPQLWDPSTPMAERRVEAMRRLAAYPDGTFAPFNAAAWTGTDYEGVLACLRWPSPRRPDPPDPPGPTYPDVPVLVLNGDLDTITASSGAQEVARRFSDATFVEVANSVHVTALADWDLCASRIYTRFVRNLAPGDTSCAGEVGEWSLVPAFSSSVDQVAPAHRAPGDSSTRDDRRLAAAAALTAADVIARWMVNYDGTSVGLRGRRWWYSGYPNVRFRLTNVRFVPGVAVTGTVRWAYFGGDSSARLDVRGPDGVTGELRIVWEKRPQAVATLEGAIGGRPLQATMPAP
jgi:pimeloyl-ACP methyl ester carboxylesterase